MDTNQQAKNQHYTTIRVRRSSYNFSHQYNHGSEQRQRSRFRTTATCHYASNAYMVTSEFQVPHMPTADERSCASVAASRDDKSRIELPAAAAASYQKWQSVSALTGNGRDQTGDSQARKSFARLRKGYASVRKSFRTLQAPEEQQVELQTGRGAALKWPHDADDGSQPSLINQIGSNAARLLRRGVTQVRIINKSTRGDVGGGRDATVRDFYGATTGAADAIESTNGSFKFISTTISSSQQQVECDAVPIYGIFERVKSDAEREVDARLRRSKRRILPSAQYKAPNSERACEGLDLNELEQIKRDNLRVTLRSRQRGEKKTIANKATAVEAVPTASKNSSLLSIETASAGPSQDALDAIVCSCKHFEGKDDDESQLDDDSRRRDTKQYYCSCASISTFSYSYDGETTGALEDDEEQKGVLLSVGSQAEEQSKESRVIEFDDDDSHDNSLMNLLTDSRRALSQPNLSCFCSNSTTDIALELDDLHFQLKDSAEQQPSVECLHESNVDNESRAMKLVKRTKSGELDEDKARMSEILESSTKSSASSTCGPVAEGQPSQQRPLTTENTHASSLTLNVRELEKLCGDLTKRSCRQADASSHDMSQAKAATTLLLNSSNNSKVLCEQQLYDVNKEANDDDDDDNDDYHNEKCSSDDDNDDSGQQRDGRCTRNKRELSLKEREKLNSNELAGVQVRGEIDKKQGEEKMDTSLNASSRNVGVGVRKVTSASTRKRRSCFSQQEGGVLANNSAQEQQERVAAGAASEQEKACFIQVSAQQQGVSSAADATSVASGAQKERTGCADQTVSSVHARSKQVASCAAESPTDQEPARSDHNQEQQRRQKQQQHELIILKKHELHATTNGLLLETKQAQDSSSSLPKSNYSSQQDNSNNKNNNSSKDLERRKRQQARREEIMLSLSSGQPDLWHELVAPDGRTAERSVDRPPPVLVMPSDHQKDQTNHIYSSLYESDLSGGALGHYCAINNNEASQETTSITSLNHNDRATIQDLREKERRLFEEQINCLRMIQVGGGAGYVSADFNYAEIQHQQTHQYHGNYQEISAGNSCFQQTYSSIKQQKQPKKSLFRRLKHLLAPTSTSSCPSKGQAAEVRDTFASSGLWTMNDVDVPVDVAPGQQQSLRRHFCRGEDDCLFASSADITQANSYCSKSKNNNNTTTSANRSRTLSSMSTQNLFNSSMRYLSASKKSINHQQQQLTKDSSRAYAETPSTDGFFSSKSFISGFLTLGRRSGAAAAAATTAASAAKGKNKRMSNNKKLDYESLGDLFTKNIGGSSSNQHRQGEAKAVSGAVVRRVYGSFDSLPSADSGLSCCHLQTHSSSSDENNYSPIAHATSQIVSHSSGGNIYSSTPVAQPNYHHDDFDDDQKTNDCDVTCVGSSDADLRKLATDAMLVVVGKARAKVDCNPCAYDKEALVFKKGDIIDILERHQSGTWIGRYGAQVGHFKFINVIEIKDVEPATGDEPPPDYQSGESKFVTKLEIRNNSNTSDCSKPRRQSASTDELRRRSLSQSHGAYKKTTLDDSLQESEQGQSSSLTNSNETLMGSLEQLLASIGLENCRQTHQVDELNADQSSDHSYAQLVTQPPTSSTNNNDDNAPLLVATGDDNQQKSRRDLSYLELLNEGGINSLDSFSSIERTSDLERIGIIDEEHRRRLLMAARIIRQALKATKLELSSAGAATACNKTNSPPSIDRQRVTPASGNDVESSLPPPLLPPASQLLTTDRKGDKKHANHSRDRYERPPPAFAEEKLVYAYNRADDHKLSTDVAAGRQEQSTSTIKTMQSSRNNNREPIYVNLLSTNKISTSGQSANSDGGNCNAVVIENSQTPCSAFACNKSISKQSSNKTTTTTTDRRHHHNYQHHHHLTTFGTNFLFNDLSQDDDNDDEEEEEKEREKEEKVELNKSESSDRYPDHNECKATTTASITNQRNTQAAQSRAQLQQQQQQGNTSQRRDEPHLAMEEGGGSSSRERQIDSPSVPSRSVNNLNSINQLADCYQMIKDNKSVVSHCLDRNNNNQKSESNHNETLHLTDVKLASSTASNQSFPTVRLNAKSELTDFSTNEESMIPISPRPSFARGCSVRVSSRKPKRASSRLTGLTSRTTINPKRSSHDCSTRLLYNNNSQLKGRNVHQQQQQGAPFSVAHCSVRSALLNRGHHQGSSSELSVSAEQPRQHYHDEAHQRVANKLISQEASSSSPAAQQEQRQKSKSRHYVSHMAPHPNKQEQTSQQQQPVNSHHASYHLLNPQSQIMNSKSAYDLRVNFSKFLEI